MKRVAYREGSNLISPLPAALAAELSNKPPDRTMSFAIGKLQRIGITNT